MVASSLNSERAYDALAKVRALVEEHGSEAQQERLTRIMGGPVPPPRLGVEFATYQSESIAILAEMVVELKAERAPRRRGRPRTRKTDAA